jgi:pyruvate kinase
MLTKMIESGINIVRLNMSHGSHKFHATIVANARSAAEICFRKTGFDPCLAIALDTKGPEIRTGRLQGVIVLIKKTFYFVSSVFVITLTNG